MKKNLHIVTNNIDDDLKKKNLIICEKCRKFLGHRDNNYEIITWAKININKCFCNN